MTKLEQAARQALGALEVATTPLAKDRQEVLCAITTLREALSRVQSNLVSLYTRNMRHVCQALQDGEITVNRAMECIEGIEAQSYTDDWLPKFQAFFGEELPIDAVKSAQARIFDMLLGDDGQAWEEARKYIEKVRPDLYQELQKRGAL